MSKPSSVDQYFRRSGSNGAGRHSPIVLTTGGLDASLYHDPHCNLRGLATFELLYHPKWYAHINNYMHTFLSISAKYDLPILLDTTTWRASSNWFDQLGVAPHVRHGVFNRSVHMLRSAISHHPTHQLTAFVGATVGPMTDAYVPADDAGASVEEAEKYHTPNARSIVALGEDVDIIQLTTMTSSTEAIGALHAVSKQLRQQSPERKTKAYVSFILSKDGKIASGEHIRDAIARTNEMCSDDDLGNCDMLGYSISCLHPLHLLQLIKSESVAKGDGGGEADIEWVQHIIGFRGNASKKTQEELDKLEGLDCGDVDEWAEAMWELRKVLPKCSVFGGCCGTDETHCEALAKVARKRC